MKHLIETEDLSSLGKVDYDRIVLDSTENDVIVRGGGEGNPNGYSYVDLGLPSGLKWAAMNIGATTETDYGDYFMWGSVTPNTADECTWANYKYCNGSDTKLTKYNTDSYYGTVDKITTLESVDDAATQIMGGDWRMPTETEIQELINNTTNKWVTNYNGSGVNGRKFTSKTDPTKYIFIPASGYRSGSSFYNRGDYGSIWSSSLDTSTPKRAYHLYFNSNFADVLVGNRNYGRSVRGVL